MLSLLFLAVAASLLYLSLLCLSLLCLSLHRQHLTGPFQIGPFQIEPFQSGGQGLQIRWLCSAAEVMNHVAIVCW